MKPDIHPEYVDSTIRCACGNTWATRSTQAEMRVDVCSSCHPFFTGEQRIVDTAGRVERFRRRYALSQQAREQQAGQQPEEQPEQQPAATE